MALQHIRSSTLDKRPQPASLSDAQLAINTNVNAPGVFFKDSNGTLVKVGPTFVGATAPNSTPASGGASGNTLGEQWLDTSGTNPVLKIWDGSAWQSEAGEFVNVSGDTMTGALVMDNQQQIRFRETTANGTNYIALQAPASVAFDKTITLPDVTGTVVTTGDTGSVTSTMILDGTIVNGDINASAAIAGTKISPDFGSQTVQTTGVFSAAGGAAATPSITFTGDLNTGLWSPTADTIAASTGGSERLRIDSSGRLGLGTSSPSTRLHVSQTGSSQAGLIETDQSASVINFKSTGQSSGQPQVGCAGSDMILNTNGAERVRIDSSGRVGIGTTSPVSLLQVGTGNPAANTAKAVFNTGDTTAAALEVSNWTGSATTNGPRIFFDNSTRGRFSIGGGNGVHSFVIRDNEAASDRLTVDSSGRFLVGTSTAATGSSATQFARLQVNGNTGGNPGAIALGSALNTSSVVSGSGLGYLTFSDKQAGEYAWIGGECDGTPGTNDYPGRLVFSTTADGASSPTERMRINSKGALHLSTSGTYLDANATYHEIYQSNNNYGLVVYTNDSSTYTSSVLHLSANRNTTNSTFNYLECYNAPASNYRLIIRDSGNVVNVNNSYGAISDIKLKENIVDANSQWNDLKALQVRNYNFKEGQTHTQIGLIAQEVELVSPGLVTESPDRDAEGNDLGTVTKSVNYSVLYMKAVKALQEAMERIEQLETEMAAVKAQLL